MHAEWSDVIFAELLFPNFFEHKLDQTIVRSMNTIPLRFSRLSGFRFCGLVPVGHGSRSSVFRFAVERKLANRRFCHTGKNTVVERISSA